MFLTADKAIADDVSFKTKVKLTSTEKKFLTGLAKNKADLDELVKSAWMLVAVGAALDVPNPGKTAQGTVANFAEAVTKIDATKDVPPSIYGQAAKGLRQLGDKPIHDQLTLFITGTHYDFKGYRPKGANRRFFLTLEKRFRKIVQGEF